jgi:hypothetical protein
MANDNIAADIQYMLLPVLYRRMVASDWPIILSRLLDSLLPLSRP